VPSVILARLTVDRAAQRQFLSETLLIDALRRTLELPEVLGVHAVEVDAIDEPAKPSTRNSASCRWPASGYGFTCRSPPSARDGIRAERPWPAQRIGAGKG
jgi:hypothetical protein